ncbi:MAG TPA: mechanosensitive ion channel domain-containing protein [Bacteroidales bacterium]|nr:mechanosensitive ion channel domain-containing protein [Bacteroidales bacterium]
MTMVNDPALWFKNVFIHAGMSYSISSLLSAIALVLIVIVLSWFSNLIAKTIILNIVTRIVKRTTNTWDDIFLEQKVFTRLSHFAPALVLWFMAALALKDYPVWLIAVHKLTYIYMVVVTMVVVISFIEAWHEIYKTLSIAKHRHIKGYVQLFKIIVIIITILVIVSVIFKKDISTLIAGLGAMAAVIILVFKDTLLSLVASIQLSADKMLKIGDWISIPQRDVDGIVSDITLTSVKVQNFDKTIINVPTYSLISDSFQNWRGMEEAGIRQVKRSLFIDIKSIRFLDAGLKERLSLVPELKEFIDSAAKNEATEYSDSPGLQSSSFFNSSQVTNLGIFRFYAEAYLKKHHLVDPGQAIIMRHRPYEGNGIHMQLNLFAKDTKFVPYENFQSEVMEHLLAIMNEFGLRVFQQPSGDDLQTILRK